MKQGVMFNVGDVVYYPGHGICRVNMVYDSKRNVMDGPAFVLKPVKPCFKLQRLVVSFEQTKAAGIHRVIRAERIPRVMEMLEKEGQLSDRGKSPDYDEMREKIRSGDLVKVAQAACELKQRREILPFSPRNRLLNQAKIMLAEEISYVRKEPEDRIKQMIEEKLMSQG